MHALRSGIHSRAFPIPPLLRLLDLRLQLIHHALDRLISGGQGSRHLSIGKRLIILGKLPVGNRQVLIDVDKLLRRLLLLRGVGNLRQVFRFRQSAEHQQEVSDGIL